MKKRLILKEEDLKVFMTKREKALKKRLIALLNDDGKGHKHSKFAARLADYDVQIVPLKEDPTFTAAMSFDKGIVFIGEGFLNNEATFYQLNVILRHELAHNLMMHQIRLMHKLGEDSWFHTQYSKTLHEFHNIIADFEISNTRYSKEDKMTIKHLWLNGKVIEGLVTEDHRADWQKLTVEEMYDKLTAEVAALKTELLAQHNGNATRFSGNFNPYDTLNKHTAKSYRLYADDKTPSSITWPMDRFISAKSFQQYPEPIRKVIEAIYSKVGKDLAEDARKKVIPELKKQISESEPLEVITLIMPDKKQDADITKLYTPEEKWAAMEVLKNLEGNIKEKAPSSPKQKNWYEKVRAMLSSGEYTDDEIRKILTAISQNE